MLPPLNLTVQTSLYSIKLNYLRQAKIFALLKSSQTMSKRDDILQTATRLFNERSYQAVGVDLIRDEAGVSKMTLYHYFPGKEALIQEVLNSRHERFKTSLERAVQTETTAEGKLHALFDWHARWFASADFHGCMFIKAAEEFGQAQASVLAISRHHKAWVRTLIEDVLADMDSNTKHMASLIQLLLDGMIVNAYLSGREPVDAAWASLARLLGLDATPLSCHGEIDWQ
ncbi:TetR/AcrR family transcriptional regulator [Halomonas sp. WWR20]